MIAFERFKSIRNLESIQAQHREWLKDYEGKIYSIAEDGKHKIKWATDKLKYSDKIWSPEINCIGRLKNRTRIDFDDKDSNGEKDKEKIDKHIKEVKEKLKEMKIGFIESSHGGSSNYLWIEFNRNMNDIEVKQFLVWIAPEGSIIDLNFASSRKVFPVLYAIHWRHSYQRELPIEYFEGEQVDYDSFGIAPIKRLSKTIHSFKYEEFNKEAGKVYSSSGQAELFNNMQPLFYDTSGNWWLWNFKEFKWQLVDEVDILNMVYEATGMDIITPKERTKILNSLKQEGRKNIPENIKTSWIQFQDTIIDFKTGKTFKATPKYFATNPIPWKLHNGNFESTPTMDKIFEEWVGPNYIRLLYEIIAYCLIPDYPIHRLFCFIGEGMNGKSCFLRLLKKFIGTDNIATTELDILLKSRFEVTRLHKKLVCIMGETNFNEISQTSIIKKLTGQDMIGFEYKNKNPFQDNNYAKILIATNNLPTTTDKTLGFYRRWCIIDFPNRFSEERDILNDIPDEEYESLALKSLSILKDLITNRRFTKEGSVEERQEKYESKSDFLQHFIDAFVIQAYDGYITSADFYKKFSSWCAEKRHRQLSEKSLSLAMKSKGIESEKKYFQWLYDGKGGQARCWVGIKWKED